MGDPGVKELADVHCAKADRITLVMDNLNTHRLWTLYEVFRSVRKLEQAIRDCLNGHNENPQPFVWTATDRVRRLL